MSIQTAGGWRLSRAATPVHALLPCRVVLQQSCVSWGCFLPGFNRVLHCPCRYEGDISTWGQKRVPGFYR